MAIGVNPKRKRGNFVLWRNEINPAVHPVQKQDGTKLKIGANTIAL